MTQEKILDYVRSFGYTRINNTNKQYKRFNVWCAYRTKERQCTGFPVLVFVKDNYIRMATPEEIRRIYNV